MENQNAKRLEKRGDIKDDKLVIVSYGDSSLGKLLLWLESLMWMDSQKYYMQSDIRIVIIEPYEYDKNEKNAKSKYSEKLDGYSVHVVCSDREYVFVKRIKGIIMKYPNCKILFNPSSSLRRCNNVIRKLYTNFKDDHEVIKYMDGEPYEMFITFASLPYHNSTEDDILPSSLKNKELPDIMTIQQVSNFTGMSPSTVLDEIVSEHLYAEEENDQYKIYREDLIEFYKLPENYHH